MNDIAERSETDRVEVNEEGVSHRRVGDEINNSDGAPKRSGGPKGMTGVTGGTDNETARVSERTEQVSRERASALVFAGRENCSKADKVSGCKKQGSSDRANDEVGNEMEAERATDGGSSDSSSEENDDTIREVSKVKYLKNRSIDQRTDETTDNDEGSDWTPAKGRKNRKRANRISDTDSRTEAASSSGGVIKSCESAEIKMAKDRLVRKAKVIRDAVGSSGNMKKETKRYIGNILYECICALKSKDERTSNACMKAWGRSMERIKKEISASKGFNTDIKYRIKAAMEDAEIVIDSIQDETNGNVANSKSETEGSTVSEAGDAEHRAYLLKLTAKRKRSNYHKVYDSSSEAEGLTSPEEVPPKRQTKGRPAITSDTKKGEATNEAPDDASDVQAMDDEVAPNERSADEPRGNRDAARRSSETLKVTPVAGCDFLELTKELRRVQVEKGDVRMLRRAENGRDALVTLGAGVDATALARKLQGIGVVERVVVMARRAKLMLTNLEEFTTECEIKEAVRELTSDDDISMVFVVETPIGTKNACIEVTDAAAYKLVRAAEVRVGWITADVRRYHEVQRCYNCNEYGHRAPNCPSGRMERKCHNCGESGHLGGECDVPPRCAVCAREAEQAQDERDYGHRQWTAACPVTRARKREVLTNRRRTASRARSRSKSAPRTNPPQRERRQTNQGTRDAATLVSECDMGAVRTVEREGQSVTVREMGTQTDTVEAARPSTSAGGAKTWSQVAARNCNRAAGGTEHGATATTETAASRPSVRIVAPEPRRASDGSSGNTEYRRRENRPRGTAVMIEKDGAEFKELLKLVKDLVGKDAAVCKGIRRVRSTRTGGVLVETENAVEADKIKKTLEEKATSDGAMRISKAGDRRVIRIRSIDAETTENEIKEAIKAECAGLRDSEIRVVKMHTYPWAEKLVAISLPRERAEEIEAKRFVQIGWVTCKVIMTQRSEMVCYGCGNTGHIAKFCRERQRELVGTRSIDADSRQT